MPGDRLPGSSRSKPTSKCTPSADGTAPRCRPPAPNSAGSNASTDWREIVESPLIDIVDINTPNDSHAEIAIAAAQNGKHVLCEKPLALTVKQAQAMLAAAQKSKVVHMVCHNYRRIPAMALAKKMISEGALGQIYHYHARYAQDWIVGSGISARTGACKRTSAAAAPTATSTRTSLTWPATSSANSRKSAA